MLVSIVTPSFKRLNHLKKNYCQIQKIYNSFKDFEWIIVLENNDYPTINYIRKLNKKFIKLIIANFKSADKAFNEGIKKSCGKYIIFHGDDDFFVNKNILNAFRYLQLHKSTNWLIGYGSYCDENFNEKRVITTRIKNIFLNENYQSLIKLINYIMTPSVILKKKIYEEFNYTTPNILYGTDYDLWVRVNKKYKFKVFKKKLCISQFHYNTKTGTFDFNRYFVQFRFLFKNSNNLFLLPFQFLIVCYVCFYNFIKKISYANRKKKSFKINQST